MTVKSANIKRMPALLEERRRGRPPKENLGDGRQVQTLILDTKRRDKAESVRTQFGFSSRADAIRFMMDAYRAK